MSFSYSKTPREFKVSRRFDYEIVVKPRDNLATRRDMIQWLDSNVDWSGELDLTNAQAGLSWKFHVATIEDVMLIRARC